MQSKEIRELTEKLPKIAYGLETGYFHERSPRVAEFAAKSADRIRATATQLQASEERVEAVVQAVVADLRGQAEFLHARSTMRGKEGQKADELRALGIESVIGRVRRTAENAEEIVAALHPTGGEHSG